MALLSAGCHKIDEPQAGVISRSVPPLRASIKAPEVIVCCTGEALLASEGAASERVRLAAIIDALGKWAASDLTSTSIDGGQSAGADGEVENTSPRSQRRTVKKWNDLHIAKSVEIYNGCILEDRIDVTLASSESNRTFFWRVCNLELIEPAQSDALHPDVLENYLERFGVVIDAGEHCGFSLWTHKLTFHRRLMTDIDS
ncbi:MAG: hypothetical protein FJY65_08365 [Calditrichaeota bacterium]|nr:hypothetical protein [Calditrichota bacterium]